LPLINLKETTNMAGVSATALKNYPQTITDASWQKKKGVIGKTIKTGLGAELKKCEAIHKKIDVSKLNVMAASPLRPADVDQAIKLAKEHYSAVVEPFRKQLLAAKSKADEAEKKLKKAPGGGKSAQEAAAIAKALGNFAVTCKSIDLLADIKAAKERVAKLTAAANVQIAAYDKYVAAWQAVGDLSARMVLASQKEVSTVEDLLSQAAEAAHKADQATAKKAAQRAEVIKDKLAAMQRAVEKEHAKAMRIKVDIDPGILDPAQKKEFNKKSDKRTTSQLQAENNISTLEKAVKSAGDVVSDCYKAASGSADLEKLYLTTMNKLVERAFKYAQSDIDVSSRECSGATANVAIALDNYADADDDKTKAEAKGRALRFIKHAITQLDALKKALARARKDVDKTLDSMPRDIVKPKNQAFAKLFQELERAMSIYDDEDKNAVKEGKKIAGLAPRVKALV